jgi:hypothetical protein
MAKADKATSTIDWIWLLDALREAIKVLGSQLLAKTRLKEWLATGQLPWTCMSWVELDERGTIKPSREHEPSLGSILSALVRFWRVQSLWVDWEDNSAGDPLNCALGIKVSKTHLRALLPDGRAEYDEAPEQSTPAARKSLGPKGWLADARKKHPRLQNETQTAYAVRLHSLMQEADLKKRWSPDTLLRRLYDK